MWKNHEHIQNWTCAPVNYPPTCSKCVSNVLKPIAHRVDTVWATFPKWFHTVCEHVPACQTSIRRVFDVYVTCKYCVQRVPSDRSAVFHHATSVPLPYFPPFAASRWQYKSPITCFQSVGNKIINANFNCNTYFWMHVLHSIMANSLCVWRGSATCLDNYYYEKWPTFLPKSNILIAKVHRDYDFSSSDYSVFTINKGPFYYMHLLMNYFIWNTTELWSNVKIISYPIFKYHSGHS